MQASPSTPPRTGGAALAAAFADWARTDGLTWIYIAKAIGAGLLALGIAMKLDLPQPRTAMTTVFIVMQPQSGMVFAKSFYRICGTLVGLVVMLALIGLFAQQPELFIVSTALWVGICTAGAARNRNFRSYGFVLAGYTAALIGIPASQHPDGAFMSALTRVAEIVVGILCSGFVSAVMFPQYTGELMRSTVRRRFSSFVEYVAAALAGRIDRSRIEATNARFIADVVGFEAARSSAIFESPDARMRGGRLARLNSEFMSASTRFHALHQLMNRLRDASSSATIDALEPYFREIAPLLAKCGEPVLTAADAAHVSAQLQEYQAALPKRVRATRAELELRADARMLDFDTATELLYRFVHEMYEYASTYASLAVDSHERERWIGRYQPKTNLLSAAVAGVRAAIVMTLLGAFWIATAWPSGTNLVLNAAATCALASASPFPSRTAAQMAVGTMLASLVGMVLTFGVFPHIDGFAMLALALAPALAFGVYLTTRPRYVGYGMGYCIFLCFLAGPDNLVHYDPGAYMNDAFALVLAMIVSAAAFAVFLPPSTQWMKKHLLGDLRGQVVQACRARLARVRNHFESGTRDLMFQINALSANEPQLKRDTLAWLFSVLEVGNAVIDLRGELATLPPHPRYAARTAWREAIGAMLDAVSRLFAKPGRDRYRQTLAANDAATVYVQQLLQSFDPPREERRQLQRILSHLHFVRTALLDPQSPLPAAGAHGGHRDGGRGAQQGNHHAS
ncbi:putative membrane protein YccC [Paraburkholderia caballeronis]|uniref:FUSC family protein n=1 Tax=Paraburkholderia caballeronis TaxID=416943 RepID=UPI0010649173|nr:FUSC family protein [Paraburkholderia caballeronis]TDV25399.1 putative membrane protein YccC [Paraburkholderia caballeronis]